MLLIFKTGGYYRQQACHELRLCRKLNVHDRYKAENINYLFFLNIHLKYYYNCYEKII